MGPRYPLCGARASCRSSRAILCRLCPVEGAYTVVMKFGGTSVADAERIKNAARRIVQRAEEGGTRGRGPLRAREAHRRADRRRPTRSRPRPHPREMDMLLSTGERVSCALAAMAINDLGPRGDLADGLAGRDRHRHHPHEGPHPRDQGAPDPRGARRRPDRARGRLPGRLAGLARRDHARPRRLGHHGGGAGGRARRRGLRDLHGRGRGVQRRSADRAERPQAAGADLRGDARDVGLRGRRAPAPVRGVRPQLRRHDPLPIELRRRTRYRRPGRRADHGDDHSSQPSRTPPRRRGSRSRACRTGRASPGACSPRWPTRA